MKNFLLIVQLIPAIIALVKEIEAAIPQSGQGAAKLTAFRQIIEATYEGITEMWPAIEKVIAAIVTLLNTTGVFSKK